ncbi:Oxidase FUB9 [Colletotrichum sp. SAR 10_66]|nr:Oxidase FUB9 [Colletotrichum sp. SAR 10_66]
MYRDYFNEGAMDLLTVKENEEAYDYYKIQPRVLVNVDNYDGQQGVELALKILMYEFKVAMLLAGCKSVKDITQDHLVYKKADGILAKL